MKLKNKMLLFIGLPVLLAFLGLSITSYFYSRALLLDETKEMLKLESNYYSSELKNLISKKIAYLEVLREKYEAQMPDFSVLESEITHLTDDLDGVSAIFMGFDDGKYVDGTGWIPGADYDARKRPWYAAAKGHDRIIVSEPYIEANTGGTVVTLSTEIKQKSGPSAVLGVDVLLIDIETIVKNARIKDTGKAFLIDRSGRFIAHEKFGINDKAFDQNPEFANKIFSHIGEYFESPYNGVKSLYITQEITGTDWILGIRLSQSEVFQSVNTLAIFMSILCTVFLAVIGILIYWISGMVSKPIIRLSECISGMVEYDFTLTDQSPSIQYSKNKDEIGVISRSLIQVKKTVQKIMLKLGEVSNQISLASNELSTSSTQSAHSVEGISRVFDEISQGAMTQAEDMQKGTNAMEVMEEALNENNDVVALLNNSSNEVLEASEQGKIAIAELIEATTKSKDAASNVKIVIENTNQSAIQIESASDMIKSIADQTNLLALNAAIEAARVGESGKGFAVVAEEIRKLAEQSNTFTEEIKEIVNGLTAKTAEAVSIMNDVNAIVEVQSEKVDKTKTQFSLITEELKQNQVVVNRLNYSGDRLVTARDSLSAIIENMSALAQENAASTEEAAASVQEQTQSASEISEAGIRLASMAHDLSEMIAEFKV